MIYLDNHATTVCDPAVLDAMIPYFSVHYGNSSSNHALGQSAEHAISAASKQIADLVGAAPEELIYTSGATESINIALLGLTITAFPKHTKDKIVTIEIEHKAVLSPLLELSKRGWKVEFLPLDENGRVKLDEASKIIDDKTFLVTVQLANSEIGTVQPLEELSMLAQRAGAFFHSDISQAVGRIEINVDDLGLDLVSFSAHKLYGPKGVGVLWVRKPVIHAVSPIIFGGEAALGIRPGTKPVPLIVGFGKACDIAKQQFIQENKRVSRLRDEFENLLKEKIVGLQINGDLGNRLPNNSNLSFPNVEAEALLANIPDIMASTGSACESGSIEPSRVLLAIGLSDEMAYNTVRFGFGRFNTTEEIAVAADTISCAYEKLFELL